MLSSYGANLLAKVVAEQATLPSDYYVTFLTTLPDVNDTGTAITAYEPTAVEYSRTHILATDFSVTAQLASVGSVLTWNPTEDWGQYVAYGLCDAATDGNLIMFGTLGGVYDFLAGVTVTVPANTFRIGFY